MSTTNFSSVAAYGGMFCAAIRCEEDLELSKY